MKRLILSSFVLAMLAFSSCKKCYECIYTNGFVDECCEKRSGPGSLFDDCQSFKDNCIYDGYTLRNK